MAAPAMFGLGFSELLLLVLFGLGGSGLPVGIPPAEEDPLLAKIAPEDCTFYVSWAGMAKPDPASKNHTEQLLAEAEVQKFVAAIEKAIGAGLMAEARGIEERKVIATEAPKLVKALLTKPTAAYVGSVGIGPEGPTVEAALVVSTGEDTAKLMTSLAALEKTLGPLSEVEVAGAKWKQLPTPPGAPQVLWGFKGRYFIAAVGAVTIENIVERARGEAPKWLTAVRERNKAPRTSSVAYLNVKKLTSLTTTFGAPPPVTATIKELGLSNVTHVASVSGLDEQGCVTRTHVAIDGETEGFFKLLAGKPLTAEDLAPIPADATLAVAMRLDPEKVFRTIESVIGAAEPRALAEFQGGVEEIREETEIDLSKDIFQALGDTWRVYNSPSDGGLLVTGLTAVVNVRDAERLTAAAEKIEALAKREAERFAEPNDFGRVPRHVTVKHFDHNGAKVYFLSFVGEESPVSPAWCVTDKELIVSTFPAHVKSYLDRKSGGKSVASVPEVAAALASDTPPTMIAYQDSKAMFQVGYPVAQVVANFLVGEMQREGVDIDMSAFPSAGAIVPHLQPSICTLSSTKDGIEVTTRQTLPMAMGVWQMLPAAAFTWGSARAVGPIPEGHDHEHFDEVLPALP